MIVGRVASLFRYPVKAMAAEPVESAEVSWHGLEGDRRWAFVRSGQARNGFPWFTLRQHPGLHGYRPVFGTPMLVHTPSGDKFEVDDPELAAELSVAGPVSAQKLDRGTFDSAPLSLLSVQTVDAVGAHVGIDVSPLRFRPNIVVETLSGTPFAEDSWVGATVSVGPVRVHVERRDKRCMVINIDPATGERDPAVLRGVAQLNDVTCGVYGSVLVPGRIAVGDPVDLA
ncbi:MOSC domain-containing protein [Virgisporangium aurantiacum]|uniref:Molybdenum cofactor sulfurase n=1 Tax=Virgisporangium aurantiacum TaxID=175570 RepID=A0A8J4E1I4_9ACTN|nr:MOSC domain-containing protein [Virgisporangium aurantiacum]GIJ57911.1 molybdenum cofactor sulfurase [Virgisporangium aurantiacum]